MNPPGHTAWDGNGPCGHGGINCASDEHLAKGNEVRTIKNGSHGCQPPARRTESVRALAQPDWEATWDCGTWEVRSIHFDSFLVAERLA